MATDETHYYDLATNKILCGEDPHKNTNWVVNETLVTCEKYKAKLEV